MMINVNGRKMKNKIEIISNILAKYDIQQVNRIKDFLLSEIEEENVQETIEFLNCSDIEKKEKYHDLLYEGDRYKGMYIEGNQYLIGNIDDKTVIIIDMIGEEFGVDKKITRIKISIEDFVVLISNRFMVLHMSNL